MTPEQLAEKVRWGGTLKASRYGEAALSELVARATDYDVSAYQHVAALLAERDEAVKRAEAAEARLATLTAALEQIVRYSPSLPDSRIYECALAALHEGEKP